MEAEHAALLSQALGLSSLAFACSGRKQPLLCKAKKRSLPVMLERAAASDVQSNSHIGTSNESRSI